MPRDQFEDVILDSDGEIVTTCTVNVYLAVPYAARALVTLADIYVAESGLATPGNPFNATDGRISFWADPGSYDIRITDTSFPAAFADRVVRFNSVPGDQGVIDKIIDDGSVITAKIADSAVTNAKMADDSIGQSEIQNDAVGSGEIQSGAVGSAEVADNSIGVRHTGRGTSGLAVGVFAVRRDTTVSIVANTLTVVSLDTEELDVSGWFSGARFTPQVAGYYLFYFGMTLATSTQVYAPELHIQKNGTTIRQFDAFMNTGDVRSPGKSLVGAYQASANGTTDYFQIAVRHASAADRSLLRAWFGGHLIGKS